MLTIDSLKNQLMAVTDTKDSSQKAKVCRAVLENAIAFLYEKNGVKAPETASLLELVDSDTVKDFVKDADIVSSLHYVRILGMNAIHDKKIKRTEAALSFDNITYFLGMLSDLEKGEANTHAKPPYMSEATTRKLYIDLYLKEAGWEVLETEDLAIAGKAGIEIKVNGMPNQTGTGFCDYVLYGRDGRPLAIVEAKKTSVAPETGRHQVMLYADCMEKVYGYRPVLYYTNGYVTKVIDGLYPDREVMAFHTLDELELMMQRRNRGDITDLNINESIAGRHYQKMAITNICERFNKKHRRGLIVMATGTGKTRVSIGLVDILLRNNWVKNVLFLADRTSLVNQAKRAFGNIMKDMSICELSAGEKEYNARLMFSTYQTMINYIDSEDKRFGSGRFDLIIIDEAHRSIFNKYGAIFRYFDSLLVGLTATPKSEVDANTYSIFGCESGVPDFDYTIEEAVKEKYLVNYKSFSRTTKIMSHGIPYNELSAKDRKTLETYYFDGTPPPTPDFTISEKELFRLIYNKDTCRRIVEELMQYGIRVNGGEKLGKSIVFAYNHLHAQMIVECFYELYPDHGEKYCQLIDNTVKAADDLIKKFDTDDDFRIAVSVDMLDTGVDVPAVVNLVFFKPVKSKIKFVQMIGRGTRLCENLFGYGKHKTHFVIFDYCGNFEYFGQNPEGASSKKVLSLSQRLFEIRLDILHELQKIEYQEDDFARNYYVKLKNMLFDEVHKVKGHSNRIQVRAEMQYVDKYCDFETWQALSPLMVKEIKLHITPLLDSGFKGRDLAVAFDIRMLDVELALLDKGSVKGAARDVKNIREVAKYLLEEKASVPQVFAKADHLKTLCSDQFWMNPTVEKLEMLREEVRELMNLLGDGHSVPAAIDIEDETEATDYDANGQIIDIRTYREKVIDYLAEHTDHEVIRKIKALEPINADDLKSLEKILWEDLGTKKEYEEATDIDNLAVFIRSLVGVSQEVINEKFGAFLSDNVLTAQQQEFVKAIINYVRENGDISREDLIEKAPFDNYDVITLFGENLMRVINMINVIHGSVNIAA
ncbi:MAG: DEAD/DEAH box helicase family protein [Clostridia bacterium]|nr:DEAD/DEAH box helicase family protein [Clostridia bacterium]